MRWLNKIRRDRVLASVRSSPAAWTRLLLVTLIQERMNGRPRWERSDVSSWAGGHAKSRRPIAIPPSGTICVPDTFIHPLLWDLPKDMLASLIREAMFDEVPTREMYLDFELGEAET